MSLLIRKINKAKWFQVDILTDNDVSADAVTNCLRTTKNTLSFWRIEDEGDLDKAILAIASCLENFDTIDVVILEERSIEQYNISIVASPGDTPVTSLIDIHRELESLTFSKIGHIKDNIIERIRKEKLKRYTISSLKKLIQSAIDTGLLRREDLKEAIRLKL